MPARAYLIFTLILSLLVSQRASMAVAQPAQAPHSGCVMTTCVSGCCAQMVCCARSTDNRDKPGQGVAPHRVNLELAAIRLRSISVVYIQRVDERRFAPRLNAEIPHTLPRLAATCIQLI